LEVCAKLANPRGKTAIRRSTPNETPNIGERNEVLGRLFTVLADLPIESIETLLAVASSMAPTGGIGVDGRAARGAR
jgi:hypothetical protein